MVERLITTIFVKFQPESSNNRQDIRCFIKKLPRINMFTINENMFIINDNMFLKSCLVYTLIVDFITSQRVVWIVGKILSSLVLTVVAKALQYSNKFA